jgi:hypothetical protein
MTEWLAAFMAMAAYDTAWAVYSIEINRGRVLWASAAAASIPFFFAVMARAYVADFSTVIPAAAGAFVGTYVVSKWKHR